jgi:Protein of unknown function (DUF2442)
MVRVTARTIRVDLVDGRTLRVPLSLSKRLLHATAAQRQNVRWIGGGTGMHWPDIDEDLSVDGLLAYSQGEEIRVAREWFHGGRGRPAKGSETGATTVVSVRLPARVKRMLKIAARDSHSTVHAVVRNAIESFLRADSRRRKDGSCIS